VCPAYGIGHLPVPVAETRPGMLAVRRPLVAVAAEELRDLSLQRGLHQQLRAEPRDLLKDLRKLLTRSKTARRCSRGRAQ